MTAHSTRSGGELFIVDNADDDWKVHRYLHDWCDIAHAFDIATAYFEIGSLLALDSTWQKLECVRILMGDEVSEKIKSASEKGLTKLYGCTRCPKVPLLSGSNGHQGVEFDETTGKKSRSHLTAQVSRPQEPRGAYEAHRVSSLADEAVKPLLEPCTGGARSASRLR